MGSFRNPLRTESLLQPSCQGSISMAGAMAYRKTSRQREAACCVLEKRGSEQQAATLFRRLRRLPAALRHVSCPVVRAVRRSDSCSRSQAHWALRAILNAKADCRTGRWGRFWIVWRNTAASSGEEIRNTWPGNYRVEFFAFRGIFHRSMLQGC